MLGRYTDIKILLRILLLKILIIGHIYSIIVAIVLVVVIGKAAFSCYSIQSLTLEWCVVLSCSSNKFILILHWTHAYHETEMNGERT